MQESLIPIVVAIILSLKCNTIIIQEYLNTLN